MPIQQTSTIEHNCLKDDCLRRVREVARWWSEVGASCDCPSMDLRQRLLELRPHLARHLESQASEADPLLLADLDQLIARLGTCVPSQACWADLSRTIGLHLSRLQKLECPSHAN